VCKENVLGRVVYPRGDFPRVNVTRNIDRVVVADVGRDDEHLAETFAALARRGKNLASKRNKWSGLIKMKSKLISPPPRARREVSRKEERSRSTSALLIAE